MALMSHKNGENKGQMNRWDVTPTEAISIQKEMRKQVLIKPLTKPIKTIAGADISFNRFSDIVYAGIIVLSYPDLKVIDTALVKTTVKFPYISGLLSFREIPALLEAWNKLKTKPDLVMVDGQGICHPRRLGIATHFGLLTSVPTIGAAKSLLTGNFKEPAIEAGSMSLITDRKLNENGEHDIIGMAVRTKDKVKPMIVSPGHLVGMEQAAEIFLNCCRNYRMPEPTRQAHLYTNEFRRGNIKAS